MHMMSFIPRIFRLELLFLFGLFFFSYSCRKHDISHLDSLSVSKTTIRIDIPVGTVDSFSVQSTVPWTASLSPGADWLRIDKVSGVQGNTTVKLTIVLSD